MSDDLRARRQAAVIDALGRTIGPALSGGPRVTVGVVADAILDELDALAMLDIPPVCTSVEDVVRAAPVSGHYYVSHHGSHTWRIMRLEIEGVRRWFAIDDMSVYRDERFLGQRIGPRIRMPGEG